MSPVSALFGAVMDKDTGGEGKVVCFRNFQVIDVDLLFERDNLFYSVVIVGYGFQKMLLISREKSISDGFVTEKRFVVSGFS